MLLDQNSVEPAGSVGGRVRDRELSTGAGVGAKRNPIGGVEVGLVLDYVSKVGFALEGEADGIGCGAGKGHPSGSTIIYTIILKISVNINSFIGGSIIKCAIDDKITK